MMRAKILLLWLLALTIPVQGFAAAQLACPTTQPMMHLHHQHASVDTGTHAQHGHDASCCNAAAVAPLTLEYLPRLPVASMNHIASASPDFVSHMPAHPERPPSLQT